MIKLYIVRLIKDFVFRAKVTIVLSILIDIILIINYTVNALTLATTADYSAQWQSGLAVLYLIILSAKATVFAAYMRTDRRDGYPILFLLTAVFLFTMSAELSIMTYLVQYRNAPLTLPNHSVVINGTVLISLVFSFTGEKYKKLPTTDGNFYKCKKFITCSESLFFLMLIFTKLIDLFDWKDDIDLLNASYYGYYAVCAAVFLFGVVLLAQFFIEKAVGKLFSEYGVED